MAHQVNKRMAALLKVTGTTHADLSEATGLSTRQVTRIVSDDSRPSIETVDKWSHAMGLDPSTVVADCPSMMDVVIIGISSLTDEERGFIIEYLQALTDDSS